MEKVITDQSYQEVIAQGLPVVIDFSATWCGPCKKIAPIIEELAAEYEGKVNIFKCDVDENDELTAKFGIRNVPTVIFLKGEEIVDKHLGAASKSTFVEKVEALLK
jgi:thioredoxin 1